MFFVLGVRRITEIQINWTSNIDRYMFWDMYMLDLLTQGHKRAVNCVYQFFQFSQTARQNCLECVSMVKQKQV